MGQMVVLDDIWYTCRGMCRCVYSIWSMPFSWTGTGLILASGLVTGTVRRQSAHSSHVWDIFRLGGGGRKKLHGPNQDFSPFVLPLVSKGEGWYSWLMINLGYTTTASAFSLYVTVGTERHKGVRKCRCLSNSTCMFHGPLMLVKWAGLW